MKLSNKTQALQDLIAPAVQACDVNLWGIEFIPQGKRSLLRIFIDKPVDETAEPVVNEDGETELGRGIGVQDCVRVTRKWVPSWTFMIRFQVSMHLKFHHQVGIDHFSTLNKCLHISDNKSL